MPFSENEFESVLLDNVIEHITDPTILILEIKRVLRKSGILVIGIPGNRGYSADPDHKFNYTENNLRDLLSLHQFTFDKIYYFPLVKSSYLNNNFKKYAIYFVFRNSKN